MKNTIIVVLGIIVLMLLVSLVFKGSGPGPNTGDNTATSPLPEGVIAERPSQQPEDVVRVKSRRMKGEFCTTGRGEDAKWGFSQVLNFQYTAFVIANSEILSKETLPNGEIKIEEKRTFENVSDNLIVSDVDLQLNLKTIPLNTFTQIIDTAAAVYAGLTGDVLSSGIVSEQTHYWSGLLKAVDGVSVRNLLGLANIQVPQNIESMLESFGNAKVRQALGGIRNIQGKTYLITWYQEKSGTPMYVKCAYEDGSEVTEEEELMVLRRINTFIDSHLAPNPNCQPGDNWNVSVDCLQEVFDPYVDGTYTGEAHFVRKEDQPNGFWKMELSPGQIQVKSEEGNVTGNLNVNGGYALISPKDICLEELYVEGTASMRKLSKHHWLFTATIDGDCNFQGRIVSESK